MRLRFPPYLILLLAACAGTEVGNPTFACGGTDSEMKGEDGSAGGSGGGAGGNGGEDALCALDGSDCGLAVVLGRFNDSACPGGTSRSALVLQNVTDAPISGRVDVSAGATVEVVPAVFQVGPQGVVELAVLFAPPTDASSGADGATLTIVLDGMPVRYLVLQASAVVDPASRSLLAVLCGNDAPCELLDVGAAAVGASVTAFLTVVNDGCEQLVLDAPDLGDDGRLALVDPPDFPAPLPPRGKLPLQVAFTPAAAGPTGGNLVLTTRSPSGLATWVLPWEGRGE